MRNVVLDCMLGELHCAKVSGMATHACVRVGTAILHVVIGVILGLRLLLWS